MLRFRNHVIFLFLFFIQVVVYCQEDFQWWNEAHHWDGITHWTSYIIMSPYYMGPNSLEVPRSMKGELSDKGQIRGDLQGHFRSGEQTFNSFFRLYLPIAENLISVEFYGVPYEYYQMDEALILERRTRTQSGEGFAAGDLYFSTAIQLLKNQKLPEIAFRMACKTASGSKLRDARFTDSPGYFFDVSFGKTYFLSNEKNQIRWHGMAGFYVWQMTLDKNRQNDALLFGLGADLKLGSWKLNAALEGFFGYLGNETLIIGDPTTPVPFNDRPVVFRFEAGKQLGNNELYVVVQQGLNNFPVSSLSLSYRYNFDFLLSR